ncbi:MAG: hypothetical protein CMM84_05280 [Rhodothermaceae bacterium]|nr:hypothetical protein [Rhodothermaceae bacterium]MBC14957.1 hypothetical protein [Rhodothermaceae bacterium]
MDYLVTLALTCKSRRSDHRRTVRHEVEAVGLDAIEEAHRIYAADPPDHYQHRAPAGYDVEVVAVESVAPQS